MSNSEVSEAKIKIKPSAKTIVVVGTGLSLALTRGKYPQLSWGGLIRHGYEYGNEFGLIEESVKVNWLAMLDAASSVDEMLNIAGFLSRKMGGPRGVNYLRWFSAAFSEVSIQDEHLMDVLKRISESGVRFCTLNYDSLLEEATGLPAICVSDKDDVIDWINGENKAILHLHGHWKEPQSCVLSDSDYAEAINDRSRDFFQQNLVALQRLVYVGCGGTFEDPNFQNILKWLDTDLQSARVSGCALVMNQEVATRKSEWRGLVQPVGYGYERSSLPVFLEELFSEVVSSSEVVAGDSASTPSMRLIEEGVKRISLDSLRKVIAPAPQAHSIRHDWSYQAKQSITRLRRVWVAADWGMCEEEFIWGVVSKDSDGVKKLFELNVGNCKGKDDFVRQVKDLFDASLESFISAFSKIGISYLILRDVPLDEASDKDILCQEYRDLADIFTSFCEELRVVLVSRQCPTLKNDVVELSALDAADTKAYIENHPLYQGELGRDDFYRIHEYSNGVPQIITQYLNRLSVASLDEIIVEGAAANITLTGKIGEAIRSLIESDDIKLRYASGLLKHLGVFPYGEYLENVKRINKNNKFSTDHALLLQQLGLIYVEHQDRFGHTGNRAPKKRLVATRVARQWLEQELKSSELSKIRNAAYQLYFGDRWETNHFKLHPTFNTIDLGEKSSEVNNARALIVDLFVRSTNNDRERSVANSLAAHFCAVMTEKTYFKAVHDLYVSLKPWFDSGPTNQEYWYLGFLYGKALRMSGIDGAKEEALEVLLDSLQHIKDKKTLASAKLSIALIYSSLGDDEQAVSFARQVQKHSRGSTSIQASHIILKHGNVKNVSQELLALEAKAKKSKADVAYVNIALERIKNLPDGEEKIEELEGQVRYCREKQNSYGQSRALLSLADSLLKVRKHLDPKMISELIGVYHHLHNDDLTALHAQCHRILWAAFVQNNDIPNLLQLFKYSSLFWRLREKNKLELEAVKELRLLAGSTSFAGCERDSAYSYYNGRKSILSAE